LAEKEEKQDGLTFFCSAEIGGPKKDDKIIVIFKSF